MTPQAFADRAVGLPWVRWRSDWRACDCFGLVVLYFREVLAVDLGAVPMVEIADGFAAASSSWQPCDPEPGCTAWMAWRNGSPEHCGVLLAGDLMLHADGRSDRAGSVRATRRSVMERLYPDIRYFKPAPKNGTPPCSPS
jgi:cell wall-associated NlpC family hydrolase